MQWYLQMPVLKFFFLLVMMVSVRYSIPWNHSNLLYNVSFYMICATVSVHITLSVHNVKRISNLECGDWCFKKGA